MSRPKWKVGSYLCFLGFCVWHAAFAFGLGCVSSSILWSLAPIPRGICFRLLCHVFALCLSVILPEAPIPASLIHIYHPGG